MRKNKETVFDEWGDIDDDEKELEKLLI